MRFWNLANVLTLQKNGHVWIGTLATAPWAMLDLRWHTSTSETQAFLWYIPNRHTGLKISTPSTNSKSRYEFFNWDGAASYSQMLLNENGNVWIGTTSPGSKLDVNGVVSSSEYRLNNASFTRIATMDAWWSYGGWYNFNWSNGVPTHDVVGALSGYGYKNNGTISLFTNSSRAGGTAAQERMTILSSGNVWIGTTNPWAKLDVSWDMLFWSRIHLDPTGQGVPWSTASFWSDSNETMYFFGNGGNTFNVRTDGNMLVDGKVWIGTTSPSYQLQLSTDSAAKPGTSSWTIASDSRLKTNISNFNDGLDIINQINPVWFNYNGKAWLPTDKKYVGIIAQDMQKIAPYTISTYKAKLNPQDTKETELLNFNESALNFVMINAIKEQQRQIQELKDEIANLKK
ncbi:MAG: hypothetical protein ACD_3C00019G0001 [uncultured bacterium (gcode 4)]|uniref:Peptidase S74 domain-containing protein n=1 Tax=uncultured bacterium (gcode 4) TaxID=1234023 RepID=K2FCG6_9BACT|nr:MAG: hypothetical protein ACD_3C00019G0001 [uncultured bacterium (gcode 4)]